MPTPQTLIFRKRWRPCQSFPRALSCAAFAGFLIIPCQGDAEEAIDKTLRACLNPKAQIEACKDLQVLYHEAEKLGEKLVKKYGSNPAGYLLAAAVQKQIQIHQPLPIHVQNSVHLDTDKLMFWIRWNF